MIVIPTREETCECYVIILKTISNESMDIETIMTVTGFAHGSLSGRLDKLLLKKLVTKSGRPAKWMITKAGQTTMNSRIFPSDIIPKDKPTLEPNDPKRKMHAKISNCVICKKLLTQSQKVACSPECRVKYEEYLTPSLPTEKVTNAHFYDRDPSHGDDAESITPANRILTRDGVRRPNG